MPAHIDSFTLNGNYYHHFIFPNDDRIELQDEDLNVLLVYNSSADCHTADGEFIGRFSFKNYPNWTFSPDIHREIQFGGDLLKAEVEVSKMWLKGEFI